MVVGLPRTLRGVLDEMIQKVGGRVPTMSPTLPSPIWPPNSAGPKQNTLNPTVRHIGPKHSLEPCRTLQNKIK